MKHLRKFKTFENIYEDFEIQTLNLRDFADLISKENVWLCAIERSSGQISTRNNEIQRMNMNDLLEIGEDSVIVLIDEDGFPSVPATLRNKCSLAIIPELTPAIKNRFRIFILGFKGSGV